MQGIETSVKALAADSGILVVDNTAAREVAGVAINPLNGCQGADIRICVGPLPGLDRSEAAPPTSANRWQTLAGRSTDFTIATILLLFLSPLFLLIALGIRINSPGPALFKQERIGRDKRIFTCYKFRTMTVGCDDTALRELIARQLRGEDTSVNGSCKLHGDARVTGFGSYLRRTSMDELPQLLNVLAGNMSLVGPRPMLEWQVNQFPPQFDLRYAVSPGMTGLWQVSGRSTVSTLGMLQLDVNYVKCQSFHTDFAILLRTIPAVLRGDGAR